MPASTTTNNKRSGNFFRFVMAYKRRMSSARALPPEIDQALTRGATVLTANQRSARVLRRAYDLHQRARGVKLWEPPQILAWETWTDSLWSRLLLDGRSTDMLL